jgi:ribosomal-protein-alanine N-acetyltransferase
MNENTASGNEPIVILSTSRLVLRTTTENDIPILQERIFGDSDVMRYAFAGEPMAKDQSESFMRRFFTFGDSLTGIATLTEKPSSEVIGFAGLFSCDALGAEDSRSVSSLRVRPGAGGSRRKSGRRNLLSGSIDLAAKGCSGWWIRGMRRRSMRSRSSGCDI